jgi:hypothetical protein
MTASADGSRLLTGVAQCVPWGGVSDGPPDSRQKRAPLGAVVVLIAPDGPDNWTRREGARMATTEHDGQAATITAPLFVS